MTRLFFSLFVVSFFCFCVTGCGSGGSSVKGQVTFDDGTPLTVGTVTFETKLYQFIGNIKKDGTYQMMTDGVKPGIPNGEYRVAITNAFEPTGKLVEVSKDTMQEEMRQLIDEKFQTASRSGLTCEVNGATTYNITVTRPSENPQKRK